MSGCSLTVLSRLARTLWSTWRSTTAIRTKRKPILSLSSWLSWADAYALDASDDDSEAVDGDVEADADEPEGDDE